MVAYPWTLDGKPPPPRPGHRRWHFVEQHLPGISLGLMIVLLLAVVLFPHMVKTVPSGHVGVLWKRFSGPGIYCRCILRRGTVLDPREIRQEGLHIIWPWDELFIYDLRLQSHIESYKAISREGVSLTASINIRYRLNLASVPVLHKFIGPGYFQAVVSPAVGSAARDAISQATAEEVYAKERRQVEAKIRAASAEKLSFGFDKVMQAGASEQAGIETPAQAEEYRKRLQEAIGIVDTLVLGIELPPAVVGAINRKAEQFYLMLEYEFRVKKEGLESERKRIEAEGIRDFQKTVSQGISDSYLRWRGIEATVQLSQSSNSKIVVIGSGKDGLPIILGNVDSPAAAGALAPKPSDAAEIEKQPAPDVAKPEDKAAPADAGKPAEKTPVADAAKPAEKPPTDGSGKAAEKKPAAVGTPPEKPGSLWPLSLSELKALLSRIVPPKAPEAGEKSSEKAGGKAAETQGEKTAETKGEKAAGKK
jgi:regulator of protease activity HflC (stomatin/prohibitin superfamily)